MWGTKLGKALSITAILLASTVTGLGPASAQTGNTSPSTPPASTTPSPVTPDDPNAPIIRELRGQKELNQGLEDRIALLEKTLEGDVCTDPDALDLLARPQTLQPQPVPAELIPNPAASSTGTEAPTPDSTPNTESSETQSAALARPLADTVPASTEPLTRQQLVANLKEAAVLVLTPKGTGSGFFVTPDKVMTNQHVIAPATNGVVYVIGHGTGKPFRAQVIAQERGKGPGTADYALLDVPGAAIANPLVLTPASVQLQEVVAAGYPALLLGTDKAFTALLKGEMTAMPELGFSGGEISAIQPQNRGLSTIAHTANISGGNSGGPLVDRCGRVVGANTFININATQGQNAGFAISSPDVIRFLRENGIGVTVQQATCEE
jgi:S1-C subfamily serine protease